MIFCEFFEKGNSSDNSSSTSQENREDKRTELKIAKLLSYSDSWQTAIEQNKFFFEKVQVNSFKSYSNQTNHSLQNKDLATAHYQASTLKRIDKNNDP